MLLAAAVLRANHLAPCFISVGDDVSLKTLANSNGVAREKVGGREKSRIENGGGRGAESAGQLGTLAGALLPDAQHGDHVSRLLEHAGDHLHRYDFE